MRVLDIFSGSGGLTQAFLDRGHEVVRIENDIAFASVPNTIIQDARSYHGKRGAFDIVGAAPPCTEFSKDYLPWHTGDIEKGMELVHEAWRIIQEIEPKVWILENVVGSVPHISKLLGPYTQRCGSRYLWGTFPRFPCRHERCYGKWRLPPSLVRAVIRSMIPYEISLNLCLAIERQTTIDDFQEATA